MQLFSPNVGILFWTIIAIPGILFLLVGLASVFRSELKEGSSKLLWALIIILVPLFGTLLYFVIGRPLNTNEK